LDDILNQPDEWFNILQKQRRKKGKKEEVWAVMQVVLECGST
jgi:hypothetical protein